MRRPLKSGHCTRISTDRIVAGLIDADVPTPGRVPHGQARSGAEGRERAAVGHGVIPVRGRPFSMGGKMANPDGSLYLTAADKRLLAKSKRRQAWTIHPGG